MTFTQRRLRAVFLCAFAGALIVLLVAFAVWVSAFAQINRAMAQSDLCVTAQEFVRSLEEQENVVMVRWLGSDRSQVYFASFITEDIPPDIDAIVFVTLDGGTAIVPVSDGMTCLSYGVIRIDPAVHHRGMSAAFGQPV